MKLGAFDYLLKPLGPRPAPRRGGSRRPSQPDQPRRRPCTTTGGNRPPQVEAIIGGQLAPHAGALQVDRPHRPAGRDRADPRRERHGQGAGRPGHLPAQPPQPGSVPGHQLCGDSRVAPGERAVRPRAGRFHRRRPPPHRQVRAGRRRDDLHGRSRATWPRDHARQAAAPVARPAVRARGRQHDDPHRRPRHRRHQSGSGVAGRIRPFSPGPCSTASTS